MTVPEFVQQFFLDGGKGTLACLILLLALLVFLSGPARRKIRWVVVYLVLHLILLGARQACPEGKTLYLTLEFFARLLVLSALGLSIFLLLTQSRLSQTAVRPLPQIFVDILHSLVYVIALVITLSASGIRAAELFGGSVLLTAVLGLSLRDTLGNLFAGLAIQAQRPFQVGDWIQFNQDQNQIGQVTEINWRATTVVTADKVAIIVPNGLLAMVPIINYNRPQTATRRAIVVHVPYQVRPLHAKQLILAALVDAPNVLTDPAPSVQTDGFDDRGSRFAVKFYIGDFAVKGKAESAVRDRVWYALTRAGIEIPVPPRAVRVQKAGKAEGSRKEQTRIAEQERALRHVDFFDRLPDAARHELAALAQTRLYAENEIIIHQGDQGDELYILEVGAVVVLASENATEEPIEVARLGPGTFFGEMAALTGEARKATVKTVKECEVLVVDKAALAEVFDKFPELARHISQTIAQRQASLNTQMLEHPVPPPHVVDEHSHRLLERIKAFFSM